MGWIPQALGQGCYRYVYQPKLRRREIEPLQAEIVRRIFQRYAEPQSFDGSLTSWIQMSYGA